MYKSKLLSVLLIFFLFFTNPIFIAAVHAAAADSTATTQDTAEITVDKSKAGQVATEDDTKKKDHLTNKDKVWQFGNSIFDVYLQTRKNHGPEWLKTTDIQFTFDEDHKPVYTIETLQPWGKVKDNGTFLFWQGRYAHDSANSSTANLGLGWRRISQDKRTITGLNFFYDYDFEYTLSRIGIGAERFNKLAEYRLNLYHPISGSRQTGVSYLDNGILYEYIRAVEGLDLEAGTALKHVPWLKVYACGYYWNNKYKADEKGVRLRANLQIIPRLTMEIGYLNSNLNSSYYGQIKYQLAGGAVPAWFGGKRGKKYQNDDLSGKMYQKVERDNDIKTERYTKFVAYKGNIRTTVTNSINHKPIAGAIVQAYQNGAAVGNAVTTDATGSALINGLAVGTYIMHVAYGSYSVTSSSVSVAKDQTAATAVTMAVTDGLGSVNVKLTGTMSASDYKVTVTDSANDTYNVTLNSSNQSATISGIQQGNCTVEVIAPNDYTVIVDPNSFNLAGNTQEININSTQQTGTVNVTLSGTLSASDYEVSVTDCGNVAHKAKISSTTKKVTITGVPVGSCKVSVTAPDGYQASADPASFTLTPSGQAININSAQQTGTVNVTLSGNLSASDYTVTVTDSAKADHTVKVNSTTKTASITEVPVGNCSVSVTPPPGGYQASADPDNFTLTPSGQAIIINSAQQTGTVNVTLSGNLSASDYTVTVTDSANSAYKVKINSTTTAVSIIGVPVGNCTVKVTAPDGYQANVSPNSFTLTPSGQSVVVTSIIPTTTITARNYGGLLLKGLALKITNTSTGRTTSATTSGIGTATFTGLAAGTYTATLTDSGEVPVGSKSTFIVNDGSDTSVKVEFDIAAIAFKLANMTNSDKTFCFNLEIGGIQVYPLDKVVDINAQNIIDTVPSGYYAAAGRYYSGGWANPYLSIGFMVPFSGQIPNNCGYFGFNLVDKGTELSVKNIW